MCVYVCVCVCACARVYTYTHFVLSFNSRVEMPEDGQYG